MYSPPQVGLLGTPVDLTYKYEHVGSDPAALAALAAGQHPFLERLKKAARPAVVVGPGVLRRADREAVMKAVHDLCNKAGEYDYGVGSRGITGGITSGKRRCDKVPLGSVHHRGPCLPDYTFLRSLTTSSVDSVYTSDLAPDT